MYTKHLSIMMAALLTACGGGGGGGGSGGGGVLPLGPVAEAPVSPAVPVTPAPTKADCTLDLNGDSILAGSLLVSGQTPAQRLKSLRPLYVIQDNSRAGLTARDDKDAFLTRPRLARFVVLEHGINDSILGDDLATPLETMTRQAQAEGRVVLLTGLAKVDVANWGSYVPIPGKIAQDTKAVYVGWDHQTISTLDGTHPDQASSNLLVDLLIQQLDTAAPECR